MRSVAGAMAWEFRQRHRWGLIAFCCYLPVLFFIDTRDTEMFAFVVVAPMTVAFIYALAAFTFGIDADVAARQSIYPARMFAMPVTTSALAGWPMLYGSAVMGVLWLATRLLATWPTGIAVPILWPGLLAAVLLAWTQALTWMPYAMTGLRVIATVIWLVIIDTVVMLALNLGVSEAVMLLILVPQIPLAYLAARSAVARARRGDIPEWRVTFERASVRPHFASPARAQMWFESRLFGRSLPLLVAILLPFELTMLFLFKQTPSIVYETLACTLLTPPFLALFAGAKANWSPFLATRPLSDAALVAAKTKAAMRSTLVAWALIIVALRVALRWSGTWPLIVERAHAAVAIIGAPRALAIALLAIAVLIGETWSQLMLSVTLGMSGRAWLLKVSVVPALALIVLLRTFLFTAFPWIAAIAICVKVVAAARMLDGRAVVCWNVLVFALFAVLLWIFPPLLIRPYVLAFVAILAVPLVRLSAAPLVLTRSRHR